MPVIEVVENPRRRSRRRMTAKQRRYFGPRRARRRRRNPVMASLSNPKRARRRRRRSGYSVRHVARRRRRRNPQLFGLGDFNLNTAMWVGVGMLGSDMVPNLVRMAWPGLPSGGVWKYVNRVGGTLLTAYGVKMLTGSRRNFGYIMAGGIGLVIVDLVRDYVLPQVGLSGYVGDGGAVYSEELADVAGYVNEPTPMGGYVESPVGAY